MSNDQKNNHKDILNVVALALLHKQSGEYLLARRSGGGSGAGDWEFPGGKIEKDESQYQALCREIDEELGVDITHLPHQFVAESIHDYPKRSIRIFLWKVSVDAKPEVRLVDHDLVQWVKPENMKEVNLSAADKCFISLLN